ncbi:MAG: DNA cytosine methyltransferase [Candidatus Melainabacteria bacterium]|nr:DNA cytosine methyltransferase [Candidatus Melainabacteria bacterium]
MKVLSAIEFFSGIGAFTEATYGSNLKVIAAFDQSSVANQVYKHNFSLLPVQRNLDSISSLEIPQADLWWMSPPCTPFSVRGRRKDENDTRARSLLNLMNLIPHSWPELILLENVCGFVGSNVHGLLCSTLDACGYAVRGVNLCPSQFGIPMRRPRYFMAASRVALPKVLMDPPEFVREPIANFLMAEPSGELRLGDHVISRYGKGFDVLDPDKVDSVAICFTSGYGKCMRASGSVVRCADGGLRYFAPEEIIDLLGFSSRFTFPGHIDLQSRLHLAGNSVDVRCLRHLLGFLGIGS